MAKFIGRRVNVGFGKESAHGVASAATFTVPKVDYSVDDKANMVQSGESFSSIVGSGGQAFVTGRFAEGDLETELNVNSFGLVLLATLGASSPAAYQTSAYKHTYTLANTNAHTSLTIFTKDPIGDVAFKGCVIDTLEIMVKPEEVVSYKAGFKGRKGNDWSWTANYVTDYKFVGRDLTFKVADDTSGIAAASALSLKELVVTINKNVEYDWVLGTLEPEDVLNKQITIEGKLTLNYEDRTWRDYMLNGTNKAVSILLTDTRDTIGVAGNPAFYLELPKCYFSEWESQRGNDDIVGQTINFTALFDVSTSKLISDCYVQNTTASY